MTRRTDVSEDLIEAYASGDPYVIAEALGLRVVLPRDNELFIDIDTEEGAKQLADAVPHLGEGWVVTRDTPSRSGGIRRHVVVVVPFDLTPLDRVAWQAALGSDRQRALRELQDLREGKPVPTCFFETKDGGA